MKDKPIVQNIVNILKNNKYIIPIYQRDYAWEEDQIYQLIDDIDSWISFSGNESYFLGNLIVNKRPDSRYEVIDGQQRLTTLFLLCLYLKIELPKDCLYFEVRNKSNSVLKQIYMNTLKDDDVNEIRKGFDLIKGRFTGVSEDDKDSFINKLNYTKLVQIQVPSKVNLNQYFEIMNSRGEQLEFHEIAKANILKALTSKKDKKVASMIWNACAKMDTYIQMNLKKGIREAIFSNSWCSFCLENFNSLLSVLDNLKIDVCVDDHRELSAILEKPKTMTLSKDSAELEYNVKYESIISFPNFLLHVNNIIKKENRNEDESNLDDKKFLTNLESNWKNSKSAKKFIFTLLKCRFLFDNYFIKREKGDADRWTLRKLKSYENKGKLRPIYANTYSKEGEDTKKNLNILTLQSCLRITYTSPKSMHWISVLLRYLYSDINADALNILENYCREKIGEFNYRAQSGFGFSRIVFTYLDYLLLRDEKVKIDSDWQFQYRNSIEHFFPQNPPKESGANKWDDVDLNYFGNLALINTSGNSKFSNLIPNAKISSYKEICNQSIKLILMKKCLEENSKWDENISSIHGEEMLLLLDKDLKKQKPPVSDNY